MILVILFFIIIISLSFIIHRYIEKFSPLIYPYIFWGLYELPKINFFLDNKISETNIEYYFWLSIGAICYFFGLIFRRLINKESRNEFFKFKSLKVFEKVTSRLFYLSCIYFLYFFINNAKFNFFYFFSRRLGDYNVQDLVSSNYLFVLIINVSILFLSVDISLNFKRIKIFKIFILFIIIFLFTGSRGYILLPIIFLVFNSFTNLRKRYLIPVLSIIVVVSFFSFSFLGSLRSFDNSSDFTLDKMLEQSDKYSINDYQLQFRDESTLKYYKDRPFFYGSTYLSIFTSFIPRKLLGSYKPNMLDGTIARNVFRVFNAGYPIHPVTEARLNFGVFGFLIIFLIGYVYAGFIFGAYDLINKYIFSYLIFFSQTSYSTYLLYSFQFFLLVVFISLLLRIKLSK